MSAKSPDFIANEPLSASPWPPESCCNTTGAGCNPDLAASANTATVLLTSSDEDDDGNDDESITADSNPEVVDPDVTGTWDAVDSCWFTMPSDVATTPGAVAGCCNNCCESHTVADGVRPSS